MQLDGRLQLPNGGMLVPFLRASWMHDFWPDRSIPRSFTAFPALVFDGAGIVTVSDAAVAHLGLKFNLNARLSLIGSVDAQASEAYRSIGAGANLSYAW
jgi:outer membrane autotransporter protein